MRQPKRFDLELPIEFRLHDSDRWWQAKTENISANGILFRTHRRVPPLTPVDVKLQLPPSITGEGTVRLLCSGFVVRSVEPQLPSDEARIAATFLIYKLAKGDSVPAAALQPAQPPEKRGDAATLLHRLNSLLFIIQGMSELVSLDPSNESMVRSMALRTQQAVSEAATVARFLANTLE